MSKSDADYLRDIVRELDDVIHFTSAGESEFLSDVRTQKAVIRSYEVVGEICKRISVSFRESHPDVGWRRLMAFRDFLAHNYELISLRFVWDAVEDVHRLREIFAEMQSELADNDSTKN